MSVEAANALSARWASTLDGTQTVFSGVGVYPLLALLAPYAAGPARDELLAVAGVPARFDLAGSPTTRLAMAVWSRHDLPLTSGWLDAVPESMRGELTGDPGTDRPVLDAWASRHTEDLIPRMPVEVDGETQLLLASALLVVTTWAEPFKEQWVQPGSGPWQGRDVTGLRRRSRDLSVLRVADTGAGPLTLLTVRGSEDVDVVLALGAPDRSAAQVLSAAIATPGPGPTLAATDGPGVTEEVVTALDDQPELELSTVRFTVEGDHDLLANAELFGLRSATDRGRGHFPGISPRPLAVSAARQSAVATFGAKGFKAAAVTAIAMTVGSLPPKPTKQKRLVRVAFDRPFGFLAVHRRTGLVLVAGWVSEPDPYQRSAVPPGF
ncbi:serpin family protein [Plantactinospora solaniradicis]|uniref:Serpin family protein n=1 Tax=Plantactinospora solaniradicis TaxID=1723736 RepID=A0ABW1KHR5_9ACTN